MKPESLLAPLQSIAFPQSENSIYDEVCLLESCSGSLQYDINQGSYSASGSCQKSKICAAISIDSHQSRNRTQSFVRKHYNRNRASGTLKNRGQTSLDNFFEI